LYNEKGQLAVVAAQMADQMAQTTAEAPKLYQQIYQDLADRQEKQTEYEQGLASDQAIAQSKADTAASAARAKAAADAGAASYKQASSIAASRNKYSDHYYEVHQTKNGYAVVDMGPKSTKPGAPAKPTSLRIVHTDDGSVVAVNPTTGTRVTTISGPKPAGAPKHTKPYRFKNSGVTYEEGPDGMAHPIKGQPLHPTTGTTAAPNGIKPPPAAQTSKLVDSWYSGKPTTRRQQVGVDANKIPIIKTVQGPNSGQISYQQAYKRLTGMGYNDQQARGFLDPKYRRGERGRPWLNDTQRQTIAKSSPASGYKVTPHARYYKGHAYLDKVQVATLKAAGQLPPGETVGGRYFIKPGY